MRVYQRTFGHSWTQRETIAIELEKTSGFPPSASMLANEIGRRVQERTQRGGFRPYGCSLYSRRRRLYTASTRRAGRSPKGLCCRRGLGVDPSRPRDDFGK